MSEKREKNRIIALIFSGISVMILFPIFGVYISQKIVNNQFRIAGSSPGLEVSWQVTGVRKDAYANQNRIEVEQHKEGDEIGKYLHPEAFGLPETMGIAYERFTLTENVSE